jgi:hypothetical protein
MLKRDDMMIRGMYSKPSYYRYITDKDEFDVYISDWKNKDKMCVALLFTSEVISPYEEDNGIIHDDIIRFFIEKGILIELINISMNTWEVRYMNVINNK